MLAPWADILYGCDEKWWKWHINKPELQAFEGRTITLEEKPANLYGLEWVKGEPKEGLSIDPNVIHTGQNSGYQAINLVYHLGAKRILLIGYDLQFSESNKAHWFGDHPDKVRSNYKGWVPAYRSLAAHADELGVEIINCTIRTALTCFKQMRLEEALK